MRFLKNNFLLVLPIVALGVLSQQYFISEPAMVTVPAGALHTIDPVTGASKQVDVKEFLIDRNLVTVGEFEEFADATGYVTEAEKFGNAAVFSDSTKQWSLVDGADFRFPQGKNKPKAQEDHPVTQISWNDAVAFAKWRGKRLPTQWEWEHAANNGRQTSAQYSWGNTLVQNGKFKANTWQGTFPLLNTVEDGFKYTSPVGEFGKNELGLSDMGGNVWQWCQDDIEALGREKEVDPSMRKVLRGGSFLCDPNVCHGFMVTGRSSSTPESSLMHAGFRCAKDI